MDKKKRKEIEDNIHKGHRRRLAEKLYENDGDGMEDHELIEILLYNVDSRKNTNIIAHEILKRFGTLYNAIEASPEELMKIDGVGVKTADFFKLQAALLRKYRTDEFRGVKNIKLTPENAGRYISNVLAGYSKETMMMFCLDANCHLNKNNSFVMQKGTGNMVQPYMREIVKRAIEANKPYVIIAHNHPNGILEASEEDIRFTLELEKALSFVEIRLIDHVIVSRDGYMSIASQLKIFDEEGK